MLLLDLNCGFWFTSFLIFQPLFAIPSNFILICVICRDALLSYITVGDDLQVLGSLSMLATLLQTKGFLFGIIQLLLLLISIAVILLDISFSRIRWNNARCSWNSPPAQATQETLTGKLWIYFFPCDSCVGMLSYLFIFPTSCLVNNMHLIFLSTKLWIRIVVIS
jgi:hypothetical protein